MKASQTLRYEGKSNSFTKQKQTRQNTSMNIFFKNIIKINENLHIVFQEKMQLPIEGAHV
jgi:hypothetical protein